MSHQEKAVDADGSAPRDRWERRRLMALLVLTLVYLGPTSVAVVAGAALSRAYHRPPSTPGLILWLAMLGLMSVVIVVVLDRVFRRLLPLAVLLRMTLVFPDRAPSRFRSAIRSISVRDLERRLEEAGRGGDPGETLNESAVRLVELAALLTAHDRRTRGHSERVRAYAEMMAEHLRLADEDRNKLRWGAMLHDIGKLTVSPAILNKKGRPDPEEWEAIKGHPGAAVNFLKPLESWLGTWANAAWEHHERWDGKGYPLGLSGRQISLSGRIVAVADSYEVMTATRSYKKPMPAALARQELQKCAGTQFDPDMVRAFLKVSLGRLRWEMGPAAWIAQLPALSWTAPAVTNAPAMVLTTAARVVAVSAAAPTIASGIAVSAPAPQPTPIATLSATAVTTSTTTAPPASASPLLQPVIGHLSNPAASATEPPTSTSTTSTVARTGTTVTTATATPPTSAGGAPVTTSNPSTTAAPASAGGPPVTTSNPSTTTAPAGTGQANNPSSGGNGNSSHAAAAPGTSKKP